MLDQSRGAIMYDEDWREYGEAGASCRPSKRGTDGDDSKPARRGGLDRGFNISSRNNVSEQVSGCLARVAVVFSFFCVVLRSSSSSWATSSFSKQKKHYLCRLDYYL